MAHVGSPALGPIKERKKRKKKSDNLGVFLKNKKTVFLCFNTRCVGGFPHDKQFCSTSPVPYNLTWLRHYVSFWMYCQVPQFEGSVPGDCHWLHMPISVSRSPGYPQLLYDLAINQKFQKAASSGFAVLDRATPKTQGRLMFTSWVKNVIKDTDGQTDEEILRLRDGWLLSLWSRGLSLSWYMWMCSPNWKLPNPVLLGFYVGFLI